MSFTNDIIEQDVAGANYHNIDKNTADELKKNFVLSMAHDIKNVLHTMFMEAQLSIYSDNNQKKDGHSENVISSIRQMSNMVQDLMNASQFDFSRSYFVKVSSKIIFHTYEQKLKKMAATKNITAICEYNSYGEDDEITVDMNVLLSILMNLFGNAVKFSEKGSRIFYTVEVVNGYLVFKIKDEGIGIKPENIDKIFDNRTSFDEGVNGEASNGVGLHIVQNFVNLSGGKINVYSVRGKGTEFIFKLPMSGKVY